MTTQLRKLPKRAASSNDFTWRYVLNCRSALDYRFGHPPLAQPAARIAADLRRDGVALVPAGELLGSSPVYPAVMHAAATLECDWSSRLAELRTAYRAGAVSGKQKPYSIVLLPARIPPLEDALTRFALAGPVLDVVNAYFGMYTALTAANVWHNLIAEGAPIQSQLWHRDPEDRHILKLFLYLSDVDEGAGPFTYARGSHRHPSRIAPHHHRDGETPRSEDAEMAVLVPMEQWLTAYGPKGTLVFADTRGYHKGGWGSRSERIVYVAEFLASAAHGISTRNFHLGARPLSSGQRIEIAAPANCGCERAGGDHERVVPEVHTGSG
jgi:hypothetical protein